MTTHDEPRATIASDAELDTWVERANERIGEVSYPFKGLMPPDLRVAFHSAWNNEHITPDLIRHYADAIGDKRQLWRDEQYAARSRWGGLVAPPTIIAAVSFTALHDRRNLPRGLRVLVAGADMRFFKMIYAGDRIRVSDRYLGIEEKQSRDKPHRLFIETFERTYTNQHNEVVAVAKCPCIAMSPRSADRAAFDAIERWEPYRYSDDEIKAIYTANDQEVVRGREIRYWEDVTVGDVIPTIVAGPLSATDVWVFLGVTGYQAAFGIRHDLIRTDPSFSFRNELTNVPEMGDLTHLKGVKGLDPIGTAPQTEGLLCRAISNWMGDDGMLVRLSSQARRPNWLGDTAYLGGRVTRTYVEADRHLVDLEMSATNQRDVVFMPATATVELRSRHEE